MFNFKIKPAKSIVNRTPSEHFCVWLCLIENKPASISVDLNVHDTTGKTLSKLVILTLFNLGTERNGFPDQNAFSIIYDVEDKIQPIIEENISKYAGRFTTDGKEFYAIYTNDPETVKNKLQIVLQEYKNFTPDISIRDDPEWKIYYDMFYPPKREKQRADNVRLIQQLLRQGDKVNTIRIVDHSVCFTSKEKREQFMKALSLSKLHVSDFILFEHSKPQQTYTVELHIKSSIEVQDINTITDALLLLTESCDGVYDGWGSNVTR